MHLLVTGGAGFIGSNFVRYILEERDDYVTTIDALTYAGSRQNLAPVMDDPRHRFVHGDICDRSLVEDIINEVDVVLNFAAETHVDRSIDGSRSFVKTNVSGTRALLEAAENSGVDRFIQISTDEVYGEITNGKFSETDPLNPRNPYAATKAGADMLALSYQATYDLPTIVTRTCNNFGPRQHTEKLIPKFIINAANRSPLPVYGDGSNVREWIYVEDNCRAIDFVLRKGNIGEVYNIGSGEERTNLEVTHAILDEVGVEEDLINYVEDRPGHDQRYAVNASKINALGWEPNWTFEQGVKRTTDYYVGD